MAKRSLTVIAKAKQNRAGRHKGPKRPERAGTLGCLSLREPRGNLAVNRILCKVSLFVMARTQCTDRIVGAILASWRYDISGISPEMRKDYEQHFTDCHRCRARQKFHRSLDATLAVLTSLAVFFFLFALAVLKHIKPVEHLALKVFGLDVADTYNMLVSAGISGLVFSVIALALVMTATPAPSYLGGIAAERAKLIEERLPAAIKSLRPR